MLAAVEGHDHVVLLAAAQGVVHQVAVGAHPNRWRRSICSSCRKFIFVDHGAVHHMAGHAGRIAHQLLAHRRLDAISAYERLALVGLAVLVVNGDAVRVLFKAIDVRAG